MAKLAQSRETIFHPGDLANLWGITNENTLFVTLSRATRQKLLVRLRKGLYSIVPPSKLSPELIGTKMLHRFCYISTETILAREGYISRSVPYITYISDISEQWTYDQHHYKSRQLAAKFLYNPDGIEQKGEIFEANVERAIADMLYFNPLCHFDRRIDIGKIITIQKKIGYPLTKLPRNTLP
jgi:predicted transcriptional regulator of viral defense system